jgi:glycosyltransferase involved in cell wall biosynthesis
MRILYHHRTLADGAEGVHIASMIDAFRSLGHEVRLIGAIPGMARSAKPGTLSRIRGLLPSFVVELVAVAANVRDRLAVTRAIRDFRPDVVYKRHGRFDVAAVTAAERSGIPVVLEVNCLFSQPPYVEFEPLWLHGLATRMERRALKTATVAMAVSSPLARAATSLGGRAVLTVPNGVDLTLFEPRNADPTRIRARYRLEQAFIAGWVGVLRDWHGLELLIEALRTLPQAHLLVVGDGPGRATLETAAGAAGIGSRLTVTGRIPHDEMPNYIAAMDVAVVAGERTGVACPMKLLEYMAMERAVVAPRLDNIEDVVADGHNGLLFRTGDAGDLAARLSALAADPARRAALGRAARVSIEEGRTWTQIARQVLSRVENEAGNHALVH